MTESTFATAATWSYGAAVVAYAGFALRVILGLQKSIRATLLLGALVATAVWAASCLPLAWGHGGAATLGENLANALRYALWAAFVGHLLVQPNPATPARRVPKRIIASLAVVFAASVIFGNGLRINELLGFGLRAGFAVQLALAVLGMIVVEQFVRRVQPQQRWGIKPLALALFGAFGFDLYLYADAMLFGRVDADVWVARGFANVVVIPFIAMATARNTGWTVELHVSRKAVFHSTAMLISGVFLLAVAGAGYFIRYFGGDWGRALAIELLFSAIVVGVLIGASGRFRAKLKVFVSKHFFSYRYDYREEWLRFTRTLATESPTHGVQQRTIIALANLVESPSGALWLRDDARGFAPAARWNVPAIDAIENERSPLPAFLERTGWVVSVPELRAEPSRYAGLELPEWLERFPTPWLVIPLMSGGALLGFVVVSTPRTPIEVDWEVRDLLKTASRQAASYLGEILASEALLEARKFEAFNRMSAFVVHDLKNLVAQLSLMLKNAKRHRDNPAFQADMLSTVEHVVARMNGLMLQLRAGSDPVENRRNIDLEPLVRRVCNSKRDSKVRIEFECREAEATLGHEDRLEHVIGHLLQNAIDASPAEGQVSVRVEAERDYAVIVVEDRGNGMSPEFVRERLFKPFQTTKSTGMGIGVYESAQYVSRIGGEVRIDSAPGAGTQVRVRLPRVAKTDESSVVGEHLA